MIAGGAMGKPMNVLVLAATKGGVGKTTLASALAVRAASDSKRVALIDTDPQASLARWWELRGEPDNPKVRDVDASSEAIGLLMSEGWDWVIIDTPPALYDRIEVCVMHATYVLIPTKASAIDLEAVDDVVDLCNDHNKPFGFILNQVVSGWGDTMIGSAQKFLGRHGHVFKETVTLRKPFVAAMTSGKTGAEKDAAAREEIDALWKAIKTQVGKAAKARV